MLEKYIENGGKALDYHELPYHIQRQLEMGRVHELLYQDVNRWLMDNAPNPHHTMPSWLSAEEGRVRTMSGKPHTPRKLRKDQNIKPEEARMRKKMEAEYTVEITGFTGGEPKRITGTEQELKDELFDFQDIDSRLEMVDYYGFDEDDYEKSVKMLTEKWNEKSLATICDNDDMLTLIETKEARMRKKMEAEYYEPFSDDFYELTEADEEFWETGGAIGGFFDNPLMVENWLEMRKNDKSGNVVRSLMEGVEKSQRKIKILERRYRDENIRTFLRRNTLLSKNVMNPETDGDEFGGKNYFKTPEGGWGVAWLNEAILAIDMEKEHIYDSQMNMYGDMGDGFWDYLGSLDPIRRKFVEDRDKLKNVGAETFEAQSKGKSKCSKHYWDVAMRRNPISGERQFFNQCLLCGKKDFSRGGSAMSDRGFYAEEFGAESPFKSDAFNEGRSAGITMFVPEGDAEDYYSNLDTEYMIFYGLSPEDLAKDIDGNSKRYLQFVAGWDDGWNYATLLHEGVLTDDSDNEGDLEDLDYEMAGEWIYQDFPKGLQEYVPSSKEMGAEVSVIGGLLALGLGYFAFKDKIPFKGETFNATESCSEDEDCPDGKVCVDGKCLPICVDDGDCASWRECRDDLHPTEKVCGEDKTDSNDNPFDFIKKEENQVDEPTEPSATKDDTYSTTTKTIIGAGIVGAIGVGIKVLGGMKDKGDE